MNLASLKFQPDTGWNADFPKELDSEQTLILVFADPQFQKDPKPLTELFKAFPKATIIGCSTAGEISGAQVSEGSISVAISCFKKSTLKSVCEPIENTTQSFETGKNIGKSLLGSDLKGVLIISDGLKVNGSELVRGLSSVLPPNVTIGGGLAGDGSQFKETWVIHEGKPESGYVTAVGIYGDNVQIHAHSQGGWDPFGPERLVTKSDGNILYELDGKPALSLYKEYLQDRAKELPASALLFPLSLRSESLDRKGLVRTVLAVDDEKNSMTFAGDIPEGSYAQLMKANFDRLIDGASRAAEGVFKNNTNGSENILAIAISCVGRKLVLGVHTEDETEATLSVLPKGTHQVGFYSYGEISPLANGKCDLHNQTMTITTIHED